MTAAGSGAVFFLGSRAHYQVLQQPESHFDAENGNSTETIYKNPSAQGLWTEPNQNELDNASYTDRNWSYCDNDVTVSNEKVKLDIGNCVKRRFNRRPSETTLCERDSDMKPTSLNRNADSETSKKPSRRRISVLAFLTSLAKRKRRLDTEQIQYLHQLESALTSCTYRESCRCLECQSRYFECDESDEYCSDDDSDYSPRYVTNADTHQPCDDDDEVFVDTVPGDNTSTDLLIEAPPPEEAPRQVQMSTSSSEVEVESMEIEVAAGTPVLLNYLLTHPITCNIQ